MLQCFYSFTKKPLGFSAHTHWIEQAFDQVVYSIQWTGTEIEAEWSYEQKKGNDCKKRTDPKRAHKNTHTFQLSLTRHKLKC